MQYIKYLLLLCSLAGTTAFAQEIKKEKKEVFVSVDSIDKKGDSLFVFINSGEDIGLEKGLLVKLYSKWRSASSGIGERDFGQAGFGWLHQVNQHTAVAVIELFNKKAGILEGDLLSINIKIPVLAYRSIFSELALLNIEFLNTYRDKMYSLKDLLYNDSKAREDSILNVMVGDIIETYDYIKDMEDFEALKKPLIGSRFKGKSVFDVMRDADKKAVMSYLLFVKLY
jgi:hypothetical protein